MKAVSEALRKNNISFSTNECVAGRSTFKVGGVAALAVYPDSTEALVRAVKILDAEEVRFEVLGNCSNTLLGFDRFDGALIFTSGLSGVAFDEMGIYADAGVSLSHLARLAADRGLSGMEFAYGIPGLVGGSVYMNSGAYGSEMAAVVEYSCAYDRRSGEKIRIYDHGYGYRKSVYMENKNLVCLGARFRLSMGDPEKIKAVMAQNMASRREKQPLEYPSAGSYFKRPAGNFAGKLIEDAGLKGMRVGGAQVSEKHAGFIINRGGATAEDILTLEKNVKEIVMSRFGVELEREVRLIK